MVTSCCVEYCKSVWFPNSNLSFHNFPWNNKQLMGEWLEAVPIKGYIGKFSRVCSLHFKGSDFERHTIRATLKKTAVPYSCEYDVLTNITVSHKMSNDLNENVTNVDNNINYISLPTTAFMYSTIPTFEESTIIRDSTDEIQDSTDDCTVAESYKNCRLKVSLTMTNQDAASQKKGNYELWKEKEIEYRRKIKILHEKVRRRDLKLTRMSELVKVLKKQGKCSDG